MQRFGGYLIFFAVGSALLSMTNYQFRILMWMDDMGDGAWVVRGVMLAAGLAMIAAGSQVAQPVAQTRR